MKCPHCGEGVYIEWKEVATFPTPSFETTSDVNRVACSPCPLCGEAIVVLETGKGLFDGEYFIDEDEESSQEILYPKNASRPISVEVPSGFRDDFAEACAVLQVSPKASAALSRRTLQRLLHDEFNIEKRNLANEIDVFLELQGLPSALAKAVDAIRHVGNFAAHPVKVKNTGEIVEVEPGEAEWTLDVLEELFDFAFVQPAKLQAKREALNQKLSKTGKPPMKG